MIKQPDRILWWTIPILSLPILYNRNSAFDLQLHSTYFIFAFWQLAILFTLILVLYGRIYRLLRSYRLIKFLSFLHSIATSGAIIGIAILTILQTSLAIDNFETFDRLNTIGIALIQFLLGVQIVFLINMAIGIFRGRK